MKSQTSVEALKPDVFDGDLSPERFEHYATKQVIAVDTETLAGCLSHGTGYAWYNFVMIREWSAWFAIVKKAAPLLKRLLEMPSVDKLFHYARFDVAVLRHYLDARVNPIWCTKIASKLVRTYTDRHSLKELGKELLQMEMDKSDQSSDWAREDLSDSQLEYAANDVRVLIPIYNQMCGLLEREGRMELAQRLFLCLPVVSEVDLGGWKDIFEH